MESKKPVSKKKIVSVKKSASKWPESITNSNQLNQAVVCFLHEHEKWIHEYAGQVNPSHSAVEQLASLIVGLMTNEDLVKGKHSLSVIVNAAAMIAKKHMSKKPAVKKAVAKKVVAKKVPAKKLAVKKAPAKKAAVKKAPVKKVAVKKAVVKKSIVKKAIVKKAPAKKLLSKKSMMKKAS